MKKTSPLLLSAALLLLPALTSQASVVLVDFGATNSGHSGYNEITTLASMASPVSLVTTTGESSGITLSYSGPGANTGSGNGVSSPFPRSAATQTAWATLAGGDSYSNVNAQGLAFRYEGRGNFTLSGLTVGQEYEIMVLFGVGGSGNGNWTTQFIGIQSEYTYTNFDTLVGKNPSYNSGTQTLTSGSVNSGQAGSFLLNFTAADENLVLSVGTAPVRSGIQGFALKVIPEPSTALLGGLGILFLLRRRSRREIS